MKKKEKRVLNISADLWNAFNELDQVHPSDKQEVCFLIHGIQNIILAREGLRTLEKKTLKKKRR